MSPFYGRTLARIHHDAFGGIARAAGPAVLRWLRTVAIRSGTVVDLGCESGILLAALGRAGYRTVGVDASPAMLRLARKTAPGAMLRRGSLFTAPLPPCDVVTATGEALCYLPPGPGPAPSLRTLFRRVRLALRPGGLFIFDVLVERRGTPMAYRTWMTGPGWAVLVDVSEDRRRGVVTRDILIFRKGSGGYQRTRERHRARRLSRARVLADLRAAGFAARTARGYGKHPLPQGRLIFIARRNA